MWNGGATNAKVTDLLLAQRRKEEEEQEMKLRKKSGRTTSFLASKTLNGNWSMARTNTSAGEREEVRGWRG